MFNWLRMVYARVEYYARHAGLSTDLLGGSQLNLDAMASRDGANSTPVNKIKPALCTIFSGRKPWFTLHHKRWYILGERWWQ